MPAYERSSLTIKKMKSTYKLRKGHSFKGEAFYEIPCSWRPGARPVLKIRIAAWRPKEDRANQAVYYYDVDTHAQADDILTRWRGFDFTLVQEEYEKMWCKDNFEDEGYFNTGQTTKWWTEKFIPYIIKQFKQPNT
jgi:hypothetical protein